MTSRRPNSRKDDTNCSKINSPSNIFGITESDTICNEQSYRVNNGTNWSRALLQNNLDWESISSAGDRNK